MSTAEYDIWCPNNNKPGLMEASTNQYINMIASWEEPGILLLISFLFLVILISTLILE